MHYKLRSPLIAESRGTIRQLVPQTEQELFQGTSLYPNQDLWWVNKPAHWWQGFVSLKGSGQSWRSKLTHEVKAKERFSAEAGPKLVGALVWPLLNYAFPVDTTQKLLTGCNTLAQKKKQKNTQFLHVFVCCHVGYCFGFSVGLTFRKIVFKSWGSALLVACTYNTQVGICHENKIRLWQPCLLRLH